MSCKSCKKIRRVAVDHNPIHPSLSYVSISKPEPRYKPFKQFVPGVERRTGANPMVNARTLAYKDEIDSCNSPEFRTFDQVIRPKRYADMQVPPAEAPTVEFVRTKEFKDNLVDIVSAQTVKNLCKEQPKVEIPCPDCSMGYACEKCVNPDAKCTRDTEGAPVSQCLLDAKFTRKMTLLGRIGRRMAKLVGEGVLWLDTDGTVSAKSWIPLKVQHLWHQWIKPNPNSAPIIGQPMPYPYQVITDIDGNPYVQQGLAEEDSITVWNHEDQHFEHRGVSDFPTCVRGQIPYSPRLELVGFDALGINDDPDMLRCLKKIDGEGLLTFRRVETAPTPVCECGTCEPAGHNITHTTIAEFLPNPVPDCDVDCPFILAFIGGRPQWVQATSIECLKGLTGDSGIQGIQGVPGSEGAQGLRGVQGLPGQDGRDGNNACC